MWALQRVLLKHVTAKHLAPELVTLKSVALMSVTLTYAALKRVTLKSVALTCNETRGTGECGTDVLKRVALYFGTEKRGNGECGTEECGNNMY